MDTGLGSRLFRCCLRHQGNFSELPGQRDWALLRVCYRPYTRHHWLPTPGHRLSGASTNRTRLRCGLRSRTLCSAPLPQAVLTTYKPCSWRFPACHPLSATHLTVFGIENVAMPFRLAITYRRQKLLMASYFLELER